MAALIPFRVRVRRSIEDWVDVQAASPQQAEVLAAAVPGVMNVFPRSAVRADLIAGARLPAGIEDED